MQPLEETAITNAFIMGTQKGGTTALFNFLAEHREIATGRKEPHFFDSSASDPGSSDEAPDYRDYEARFEPAGVPCRLDATPIYMYWHPVRDRLHRYDADARLVFVLRRPWDRAYSHWRMEVARGVIAASFEEALELERAWASENTDAQSRVLSFIDRGFYAAQIERLQERFDPSQMLFISSEQLRDHHAETLDRVCDFIGVSRFEEYPAARELAPPVPDVDVPEMNPETRSQLIDLFTPDVERLAALPGLDITAWQ